MERLLFCDGNLLVPKMKHPKKNRALFTAAAGAVVVSTVSYFLLNSPLKVERAPAAQNAPTLAPTQIFPANTKPALKLSLSPHQKRYTYSFKRDIQMKGFSHDIPEIAYDGYFYVDVVSISQDGKSFDAVVSQQINVHPEKTPLLLGLHASTDGKDVAISKARTEKPFGETEQQYENILKDLIANWDFPLEEDTTGKYAASFESLASNSQMNPSLLLERKIKKSYLSQGNLTPKILESSDITQWDVEQGVPRSVEGNELTRLGDGDLSFSSAASYKLSLQATSAVPTSSLSFFKSEHNAPQATTLVLTQTRSSNIGKAAQAGITWAKLAKSLELINSGAITSSAQQLQVFGDLLTYLRENGQNLQDLLSYLNPGTIQAGPASELFKITIGTLATLGTPEAQDALMKIYQDPACDVPGKGTILAALTTTQAPLNSDVRTFLISQSQDTSNSDLANGALWALGSSLQNAPSDPTSQQAISSIQAAWSTADTAQQLNLLDAMGNSGRPDFLPILENVIDNDPTALQSKAVFALRYIQTPDAESLLSQELANQNPALRLSAAQAMNQSASQTPVAQVFVAPLQKCASSESVNEIQKVCQATLQTR
jgi:hypothetical protein